MKKLIVAAVVACVATFAQASTVNWGLSSGTLDSETFAAGTAYLICVNDLAKPAAFTDNDAAKAWYAENGKSLSSKALLTGNISEGSFLGSDLVDQALGRKNYWLIFVNADESAIAMSTTTKAINIATGGLNVSGAWTAAQTTSYDVASVPEPTSGLLLLLGMAGLALKRKRA